MRTAGPTATAARPLATAAIVGLILVGAATQTGHTPQGTPTLDTGVRHVVSCPGCDYKPGDTGGTGGSGGSGGSGSDSGGPRSGGSGGSGGPAPKP